MSENKNSRKKIINKKVILKSKNYNEKIVSFKNISHSYGTEVVLKGVTFDIYEGEFVTILGPSGCGKTTILRILAGFIQPDSGEVLFKDKLLTKIPTFERPFNTVFQNYALFPTMNVFDNVAYGLRIKKINPTVIIEKVETILKKVGMEKYTKKYVDELSGGQKQRVALARSLINEPQILLLDEPLAALDVKIKKEMQLEIKRLHEELGITFVYVTHDQEEALRLSDTVMVMNQGFVEQIGSPQEIYDTPNNRWIASFIGQANIYKNAIFKKDRLIELGGKQLKCVDVGFGKNTPVDIVIRPEDIEIKKFGKGFYDVEITSIDFTGVHYEIIAKNLLETWKSEFIIHTTKKYQQEEKIGIKWEPDAIHTMWKEDHEYAELES